MKRPTLLLTGTSGVGKSTAVLRATHPATTLWICCERGALQVAHAPELNPWRNGSATTPLIPHHVEALSPAQPFEEVDRIVRATVPQIRDGKIKAVVIDTLSSLCDREYARIRMGDKVPESYGKANRMLAMRLQSILWHLLDTEAMVIAIAHEREPTTIEGKFMPGGPKLAGDLVRSVPALFDMVLRLRIGLDSDGKPQRQIAVDPMKQDYLTKDRFAVAVDGEPADLRAILMRAVERRT